MKNFVIQYARMPMVASLKGGLQAVFLLHTPHFVHFYITYNGKERTFIKKRSLSCKTRRLITMHLRNGLLHSVSVFISLMVNLIHLFLNRIEYRFQNKENIDVAIVCHLLPLSMPCHIDFSRRGQSWVFPAFKADPEGLTLFRLLPPRGVCLWSWLTDAGRAAKTGSEIKSLSDMLINQNSRGTELLVSGTHRE